MLLQKGKPTSYVQHVSMGNYFGFAFALLLLPTGYFPKVGDLDLFWETNYIKWVKCQNSKATLFLCAYLGIWFRIQI